MLRLYRWFCFRHLWKYKGRAFLCLLGVALGVAVFVAIKTASSSASASFAETVTSLTGKTQLQVVGQGNGFPEELYVKVSRLRGVKAAAPVLEFNVMTGPPLSEPLFVLGVDIFTEQQFRSYRLARFPGQRAPLVSFLTQANSIALTKRFARRHGLQLGDRVEILSGSQRYNFVLRLMLELQGAARALEGNLALVDIATAQETFARLGRLDRIDLLLQQGTSEAELAQRLSEILPANVRVQKPAERLGMIRKMVRAYQLNLTALSMISLFVGLFLIYNAVAFAVSQRRYEIAMLRVLGASRYQVLSMFLVEALIVGALGALLGAVLGLFMAKAALNAMTQTISELYLLVRARTLTISAAVLLLGATAGMAVALLGSLLPSLEASRTQPREALSRGTLEKRLHLNLTRISSFGAALLGVAYLCSRQPAVSGVPLFGFASAFFLLAGFSFLTPAAVLLLNRLLAPVCCRLFNVEGRLASRYLGRSVNRSAVAIASLMAALAMLISISIMILSFRQTVVHWTEQIISADLYLAPGARIRGQRAVLPPEIVSLLPQLPGFLAMDRLRELTIHLQGLPALLCASDLHVKERYSRVLFRRGSASELLRRCRQFGQIAISEVLATRMGLSEGNTLELPTPTGSQSLLIAGIFYDYRTEGGMILMDHSTFQRYWPDEHDFTSLGIYLQPGVDVRGFRTMIRQHLQQNQAVQITSNRELRREILRIFDQTFAITYALQVIAIVVAIFGIVNTLVLLINERARDLGVLKAVGSSSGQLQRMTLLEAVLMGLSSFVLGAISGVFLSMVLIFVINKQSFGWTIQFTLPPALFGKTLALVLGCAVIAGIAPARIAATRSVSELMRFD
ncbi:MAG: ABC transporter permease [Deltaproteobacteria bacterium]|nr:ABC transporter permease [Deltaproteobacteria bacterium]MBW2069799.1 ABC transporter permease [Deltaproteobacteria bacterium]